MQKKENKTGLPDNLKTGIENLSGASMDNVKVHYNSDKPVQLQATAYAQGTNIHLAPEQEKHLPHENWHVVQQKQGRVKPTLQMKGGVSVDNNTPLEKEADIMGQKLNDMLKKGEHIEGVPSELQDLIDKDQKAKDFFDTLSKSYKQGYCDRVGSSKQEATRLVRAEKALKMLQNEQKTLKT
jgi:hypothetical protein